MKKRFTYYVGRPSWHQARAGHTCAAEITVDHTPEEHAAFMAKAESRNEPVHFTSQPIPTP